MLRLASYVLVLAAGTLFASSAAAVPINQTFNFSDTIAGGANPLYVVDSTVSFDFDNACVGTTGTFCTLTLTLTANPTASGAMPSQGELLTAVVFNVLGGADFRDGPPGNIPWGGSVAASALEGSGAATALGEIGLDVSAHWGLNPAILVAGRGNHALSSVGDLFNAAATLGSGQLFPGTISSIEPSPPNGSSFGIIDSGSSSGGGGWPAGSIAFVQDEIVASLLYTGTLTGVDTVDPLYGTMGLPLPEPSTAILLAMGLLGGALAGRRRSRFER